MKLLALVFLFCICAHAVAAIKEKSRPKRLSENASVCTSVACNRTAAAVKFNIDENINPCDDFYKFACGGFIADARIPKSAAHYSYFNIVQTRIYHQLTNAFKKSTSSSEIKPMAYLKKFYKLCMDTTTIENNRLNDVKRLLERMGGWPVLEESDWDESKFDWKNFTYKCRKHGLFYDHMIGLYVTLNRTNPSQVILEIAQPKLGLEHPYLIKGLEDKMVKDYYRLIIDLGKMLGGKPENLQKEIKEALEFEIQLARISRTKHGKTFLKAVHPMTLVQMQNKYPSVPWLKFLNTLIDNPSRSLLPLNSTNVANPEFLTSLEPLLKATPKRVQANYLMYRTVVSLSKFLTREFRDRLLEFYKVKYGVQKSLPRSIECTLLVSARMPFVAGSIYARNYFSPSSKKKAEALVEGIKDTFVEMLKNNDWMDNNTKSAALDKATVMSHGIGYPEELLDDSKLSEYYAKLNITTNNYMEFALSLNRFSEDKDYEELKRRYNGSDWDHTLFIGFVNAYYNVLENNIQIPAAILQSPFFDANRPNYMNYGAIGFVVGHEITHAFDTTGSQFDKRGSYKNWWAENTRKIFQKKVKCIIEQYKTYKVPEVNKTINGEATVGENIADNGGIKEAYLAYNNWVKANGEEPYLVNIKYTPRQLFWISAANMWCSTSRPESLKYQLENDVHSPARFRVIGALSNNDDFARDFNCPCGSKMNPERKCQVW